MKKIKRILLAVYVLCWLPLFLVNGCLLFGQVDSWDIGWCLFVIGLLALMVWGDVALTKATRGWERVVALGFVLAVEVLALFVLWFFSMYFYTSPIYYPICGPSGEVELIACEESFFYKVWGEFYRPAGPFLLKSTGVTYEAHDSWPFRGGRYELDWSEDQVAVRYDTGAGWDSLTVPLN